MLFEPYRDAVSQELQTAYNLSYDQVIGDYGPLLLGLKVGASPYTTALQVAVSADFKAKPAFVMAGVWSDEEFDEKCTFHYGVELYYMRHYAKHLYNIDEKLADARARGISLDDFLLEIQREFGWRRMR